MDKELEYVRNLFTSSKVQDVYRNKNGIITVTMRVIAPIRSVIITIGNNKKRNIKKMIADFFKRPPDVKIQRENKPYLDRWYIIPRNRFFNIYLHHFIESDYDKFLHCHPWWNLSILLTGDYLEWLPKDFNNKYFFEDNLKTVHRKKGSVVLRSGECAHKIELFKDLKNTDKPVWTLFLTGPKYREWGFYTKKAWVHWEEFLNNIEKYESVG